jgi:SAM-dependent methyltransferase
VVEHSQTQESALVSFVKESIKRLPLIPSILRGVRDCLRVGKPTEAIFTEIYRQNTWGGSASRSGPGSEIDQTRVVVRALEDVLRKFEIRTILDIPCGDFCWMKDVDLQGVDYIGADIVKDLIGSNDAAFAADGVRFRHLDLATDPLPEVDLVFCRDCLVHLSFEEGLKSIRNIRRSGSKYLLTTTFPERKANEDIVTGRWSPINLQAAPYLFPGPLLLVNEECTEYGGSYSDKSLGLWRVSDLLPTDG